MDIVCDTVPDIAAALREAAPGASWVTWEEPCATGPGRAIAFTPALGEHHGECDRSGEILVGRFDFEASALQGRGGGPYHCGQRSARRPVGARLRGPRAGEPGSEEPRMRVSDRGGEAHEHAG